MNITDPIQQIIMQSTFLFPFAVSLFTSGWFCSLFGIKTVGMTSVLLCIPACIWVGLPNQKIQLLVSALTLLGFSIGGITMAVILNIIQVIQFAQLSNQHDLTKRQEQILLKERSTCLFAVILSLFGIGFGLCVFISVLSQSVVFLWHCFSFALMLTSCIPLIVYFWKPQSEKSRNHNALANKRNVILHNIRPYSFDEHVIVDDESTLGSSSDSECNVTLESKPASMVE